MFCTFEVVPWVNVHFSLSCFSGTITQIGLKYCCTVKHVLSGHLKKESNIKVLKNDYRLLQVECIAECSLGAFYNTFGLH